MIESVLHGFGEAVGDLVLKSRPWTKIEVSEHGSGAARVRVTTIIPAQAERQRKILRRFPGVLGEHPHVPGGGIPRPQPPWPVVGSYITPPSVVGWSWTKVR